ncbi:MAG: Fur family transcriptional regulator [Casimicrobium sp.]
MERSTRQRAAIRNAIERSDRPLLPPEILLIAQADVPQLSLVTVYRNLKLLQEAGEIAPVLLPGENARFESVHLGHHHHFHCRECDRVFDIPGCVSDVGETAPRGFVVEHHEITLYGTCAECSPKGLKRKGRLAERKGTHDHSHSHKH